MGSESKEISVRMNTYSFKLCLSKLCLSTSCESLLFLTDKCPENVKQSHKSHPFTKGLITFQSTADIILE